MRGTVSWATRDEHGDGPGRKEQAEYAADDGEHKTLNQHLPDDSEPRSAERGSYRKLFSSSSSSCQQEVCDVGTGNQQHQADGAEEYF